MTNSHNSDKLETLAEEFAERIRNGERPSVQEYVENYPGVADGIREAFPVILMMEELAPTECGPIDIAEEAKLQRVPQLQDYKLIRELGRGGMGVVYEAEQPQLGRRVALKTLPARLARQPAAVERFHRESRAAARLNHENIVPIYDVGEEDGTLFYTMQLIRGHSVDVLIDELQAIRDGRHVTDTNKAESRLAQSMCGIFSSHGDVTVTQKSAPQNATSELDDANTSSAIRKSGVPGTIQFHRAMARIGIQVAGALSFAHQQGVVHRDIKPSNLMIDPLVRVWVTDFGLAKLDESDLTAEGDVLGTLRYMAPEQLRGWADPRSDVYSLGVTLYELLVLRPAFDTNHRAELMHSIVERKPRGLRTFDSTIPRDLETVVAKAIAKEPGDRYQDCGAFRDDLRNFVEGRPISARPWSPLSELKRWGLRNKPLVALAAALLVVLIGWGTSASYSAIRAVNDRQGLSETIDELYAATMAGIGEQVYAGNYKSTLEELKRLEERVVGHWEMQYVKRLLNEPHDVIDSPQAPVKGLAVSPDGTWFAAADYWGEVRVWDARTNEQLRIFKLSENYWDGGRIVASPDGRTLVCYTENPHTGQRYLHFVDVTDRLHADPIVLPLEEACFRISFSGTEGKYLVCLVDFRKGTRQLRRISVADVFDGTSPKPLVLEHPEMDRLDLVNGQLHGTLQTQTAEPSADVGTSPRSRAKNVEERVIWDIVTRREVIRIPIDSRYQRISLANSGRSYASFSPDESNRRMALYHSASVEVRDTESHELISRLEFDGPLSACKISPNGRFIAGFIAGGREAGDLVVYDIATQQRIKLRGHENRVVTVRFTPDSRNLVSISHDQTVRVWSLTAQPEYFEGPAHRRLTLSHDGSLLATNNGNEICIWDAKTLALRQTLQGHVPQTNLGSRRRQIQPFPMSFSPDGKKLVSASLKGEVIIWNVADGSVLYATREAWGPCHNVKFHPNGKSVVGVFANGDCSSLNLETRKWRQIQHDSDRSLWALGISPDGNWVVPGGTVTIPRMIPLSAQSGLKTKRFDDQYVTLFHASFSSDSSRLVVAGKNRYASAFNVQTGQLVAKMYGNRSDINGLGTTSDDKRVMTVGRDNTLRVFDPKNGKQLFVLRIENGFLEGIAIAPGGISSSVYTAGDRIRIFEPQRVTAQLYEQRQLYRQAEIVAQQARNDDLHLLREEAKARIASDRTLSTAVRSAALEHLEIRGEDAGKLFELAWRVAVKDASVKITPAVAVRYAEACTGAIKVSLPEVTSLVGMVKYRNGEYEESLNLLRSAKRKFADIEIAPDFQFSQWENDNQRIDRILNDLYLAMAMHQTKEGNAKQLLESLKIDAYAEDQFVASVLQETNQLIDAGAKHDGDG